MTKLHRVIADRPKLVIISNLFPSIKRVVLKVFRNTALVLAFTMSKVT